MNENWKKKKLAKLDQVHKKMSTMYYYYYKTGQTNANRHNNIVTLSVHSNIKVDREISSLTKVEDRQI